MLVNSKVSTVMIYVKIILQYKYYHGDKFKIDDNDSIDSNIHYFIIDNKINHD